MSVPSDPYNEIKNILDKPTIVCSLCLVVVYTHYKHLVKKTEGAKASLEKNLDSFLQVVRQMI